MTVVSRPAPLTIGRASLFDPVAIRSRLTNKSLWSLLLWDGSVIHEGQRDWLDLPQKGRRSVRLYAPTGDVATLDDGRNADGKIFQFKNAIRAAGPGGGTFAHVVGLITGLDGTCVCAVWSYRTRSLSTFTDNANQMVYENVGTLSNAHLGIKAD